MTKDKTRLSRDRVPSSTCLLIFGPIRYSSSLDGRSSYSIPRASISYSPAITAMSSSSSFARLVEGALRIWR